MFEEKLFEPHFTSVLAPYMLDVVEQKRALGNKYNAGVEALSAFDDFCNEQQLRIPAISKELLQKWEKKRPHENETTQCFRISYVRILCKYLHSNCIPKRRFKILSGRNVLNRNPEHCRTTSGA